MADEFFIKCKLLSEQNEKLSNECYSLHEEKAAALGRVRAESTGTAGGKKSIANKRQT